MLVKVILVIIRCICSIRRAKNLQLQRAGPRFSLDDLTGTPGISLSGLGLDYSTPTLGIEGDFLSQGNNALPRLRIAEHGKFYGSSHRCYIQPGTGSPSIFVYSRIDVPPRRPPFFMSWGFQADLAII